VDSWEQLKAALREQAASAAETKGEVVQATADPESDLRVMLLHARKSMTVTYIPERNAVRWETAGEYGFEKLEQPASSLAKVLMQWLFRR